MAFVAWVVSRNLSGRGEVRWRRSDDGIHRRYKTAQDGQINRQQALLFDNVTVPSDDAFDAFGQQQRSNMR